MDVYVSTVAGEPARSRADAHADGSTFVPRESTISGFATNPTRTFLANARKADRNHGVTVLLPLGSMRSCAAQISFYDRPQEEISSLLGSVWVLLNEHSFSIMTGRLECRECLK